MHRPIDDEMLNVRPILEHVWRLLAAKQFGAAEKALVEARADAIAKQDSEAERDILLELIGLYRVMDPPDVGRAEAAATELETLDPSARIKLYMATLLYYGAHDSERALAKSQETMRKAEEEHDYSSKYSSLGLQGLALLDLERLDEATKVLNEIQEIISNGDSFVAGDELSFLERAYAKGISIHQVRQIAASVVPLCKDPVFLRRLRRLSEGS
ncbi:MAG TPA: hypothetical protein VGR50_09140 [Terriglobales bacterium]|nr:hypothetical protein [Terriglobales bacterium]